MMTIFSIATVFSLILLNDVCGQNYIYVAEATTGENCVIPFVYKGVVHHDCITEGTDQPWCYVDKDFKKWEYCKAHPKEYDGCKIANPNITLSEVEEILNEHNKFRSKMPALRMRKLEWNSELAQKAQLAAEKCEHVHVEAALCGTRYTTGQNLFYSYNDDDYPGLMSWTSVIDNWSREQSNYNIDTGECQAGKLCGHFTAVVWASTNLIGCGKSFCHGQLMGKMRHSIQYYCNYFQAGNVGDLRPYVKTDGEKCKDCHIFDQDERFRCDKDQLCETCDRKMEGCTGIEDIKKLEASGSICADTDIMCETNSGLCDALKAGIDLPEQIVEYLKQCKKTCGMCT